MEKVITPLVVALPFFLSGPSSLAMSMKGPCVLSNKKIPIEEFTVEHVKTSFHFRSDEEILKNLWRSIESNARSKGIHIWDGTYYRLENLTELGNGSKNIKLSEIKYSTVRAMIEFGKSNPITPEEYTLHINTGALIRTSDEQLIFGLKSSGNRSFIDLVGGGLQSDELVVTSGNDLWNNMLKEMNEEMNLTVADVQNREIGGVLLADNMSILLIFNIQLNKTLEQVQELFKQRKDFELSDIKNVAENKVVEYLSGEYGYFPTLAKLIQDQK